MAAKVIKAVPLSLGCQVNTDLRLRVPLITSPSQLQTFVSPTYHFECLLQQLAMSVNALVTNVT